MLKDNFQRGDTMAPSNYRPVTIPSNLLRILTLRMCQKMTDIVEEKGFLGPEQFGFRRKRSTLDAMFVFSTLLKKAKRQRRPFAVAFLDVAKVNYLKTSNHIEKCCSGLRLSESFLAIY